MLSRHEKHPAPSVIEWGKAAAPRGTRFEGRGSNDLISLCGLQWRRSQSSRCCFQIRPASVTDARGAGGWRWRRWDRKLRVAPVTPEDQDCSGPLTGLVVEEDIEGSPIARWSPDTHHHVGLCSPAAEG
ncbi:unnamed protein product [Pleuronectes platessa]|uniref:Uncharacterized protein n=1 Tax=Pleuronectes platessa TaxID=8262 RepID=A0A9N7UHM2_PLEPL|nr:unnamed protein product [Pleuronectes platessa]